MPSVVTVDPDITEFKTDYSATSGEHHKEYGTIGQSSKTYNIGACLIFLSLSTIYFIATIICVLIFYFYLVKKELSKYVDRCI